MDYKPTTILQEPEEKQIPPVTRVTSAGNVKQEYSPKPKAIVVTQFSASSQKNAPGEVAKLAVTTIPGVRLMVSIPDDEQILSITGADALQRLPAIKKVLLSWSAPEGSSCDWTLFGIHEQTEAAKLASEYLAFSTQSIIPNSTDLIARSLSRMEQMLECLEPKSGIQKLLGKDRQDDVLYSESFRELESFVGSLQELSPELNLYLSGLNAFMAKAMDAMSEIEVLILSNQVLAATGTDRAVKDVLDERQASLSRTRLNLFQLSVTVKSNIGQTSRLKSIIIDHVLTGLPGWLAIASLSKVKNESHRIVAKNKLEKLSNDLKQGM